MRSQNTAFLAVDRRAEPEDLRAAPQQWPSPCGRGLRTAFVAVLGVLGVLTVLVKPAAPAALLRAARVSGNSLRFSTASSIDNHANMRGPKARAAEDPMVQFRAPPMMPAGSQRSVSPREVSPFRPIPRAFPSGASVAPFATKVDSLIDGMVVSPATKEGAAGAFYKPTIPPHEKLPSSEAEPNMEVANAWQTGMAWAALKQMVLIEDELTTARTTLMNDEDKLRQYAEAVREVEMELETAAPATVGFMKLVHPQLVKLETKLSAAREKEHNQEVQIEQDVLLVKEIEARMQAQLKEVDHQASRAHLLATPSEAKRPSAFHVPEDELGAARVAVIEVQAAQDSLRQATLSLRSDTKKWQEAQEAEMQLMITPSVNDEDKEMKSREMWFATSRVKQFEKLMEEDKYNLESFKQKMVAAMSVAEKQLALTYYLTYSKEGLAETDAKMFPNGPKARLALSWQQATSWYKQHGV